MPHPRLARLTTALFLLPLALAAGPTKSTLFQPKAKGSTPATRSELPTVPTAASPAPNPRGPTPTDSAAAHRPFDEEETLVLLALGDPPTNDLFANARVLVTAVGDVPPVPVPGDNINATKEPGEPNHGGNPGGHSVWWKWTAPGHSRVSLFSVNSDFPTVLGVYTGGAVNALTPVPALAFIAPEPEAFFFHALAGTTYYIAVDGLDGVAGNIVLGLGTLGATAPAITSHPQDATVNEGGDVLLQISISGTNPIFCQWYRNDAPLAGQTGTSLQIRQAKVGDAGSYHATLSSVFGSATSNKATLTVTVTPYLGPTITSQPAGQSLTLGETARYSVTASGPEPLTYQWFFNGTPIGGATATSLTIAGVQDAHAGTYTVRVTNPAGTVTSADAGLWVFPVATKPIITTQPAGQIVNAGANVVLSVAATGYPAVSYQWLFNGSPIANATEATLTLSNVQTSAGGTYRANTINALGTTPSADAILTVNAPVVNPPPTTPTPSPSGGGGGGGSGGGGGGGGAPSGWFLAALVLLTTFRRYRKER